MIEFSTEYIINTIANHPQEILLWSHGFFVALALRRGRIEKIMSWMIPGGGDEGETNGEMS